MNEHLRRPWLHQNALEVTFALCLAFLALWGTCGCAGMRDWLSEPPTTAPEGAPPGAIGTGGGTGIVVPPAPTGPVTTDLPDGSGTVVYTPPAGGPPQTHGEEIVQGISGVIGALNPFLGLAVGALGRIGLGTLQKKKAVSA